MNTIYKIEINLFPSDENRKEPYFWSIFSFSGKNWCNEYSGWSKTPEDAFHIAYQFYNRFKKKTIL